MHVIVNFFEEKVAPLIGLEMGTHVRGITPKGSPSKTKIEEIETGRKFNTRITVQELSDELLRLGNPIAKDLHDLFYGDLSGYIHVNILASNKYFTPNDPYYEIDESMMAGFLAVFFFCYTNT